MDKKKKRMSEAGAQALLLIGPGAELDWAELSDTLPSVGGEAESLINTREQQQTELLRTFSWIISVTMASMLRYQP